MNNGINTVLRIMIVVFLIILAASLFYIFGVRYLERYYEPDGGDVFISSMQTEEIFPMHDGSVTVVGTYLEGDSILGSPSVFVKSYDATGKTLNVGGFSAPYGFEYRKAVSDGTRILVELAGREENGGGAAVYDITPDCRIVGSGVYSGTGASDSIKAFSCISDEGIVVMSVKNGNGISLEKFSGDVLCSFSLSDAIEIGGLFYAQGSYFITGTVDEGSSRYPYVSAFDSSGRESFSINVLQKDYEYAIDRIFEGSDGKTYVSGKRFDSAAFNEFIAESGGHALSDNELTETASKAISRNDRYGEVFLASDYAKDPWCSVFISEIDARNGVLGDLNEPVAVSSSKGVSSVQFIPTKNVSSVADDAGSRILAFLVSKTAPSQASGSYAVSCYYLYDDMSLSDSAIVHVLSNYRCYPVLRNDGRLFVYLGSADRNGTMTFTVKHYGGTSEMATAQNYLSILKSSVSVLKNTVDSRFVFFVSLFLLFYATARYTGTEFKRNHKNRDLY